MKTLNGAHSLEQPLVSSVVTIGNFDGLHLGHQELIHHVLSESKRLKHPSVVVTFSPHPAQVLFPEKHIKRLFPLKDQESELEKMGIDYFCVEPFSRDLSQLSPERFLVDWVLKPFNAKTIVVGYDFSFGSNRSGSIAFLEEQAKKLGFDLIVIPPLRVNDEIVSSTVIRNWISEKKIEQANEFLGRPFYLEGVIEKGKARGRQIGFPTANLYTTNETLPAIGVYACNVYLHGKKYIGVTNVGKNPTFMEATKHPVQVECHILNFDEDIYGEVLKVEFLEYIRDEKKFNGIQELVSQIQKDVAAVRVKYA